MEIKTCEQYVLAELANKEKTIANLNDEITRLNVSVAVRKNEIKEKETIIQTCCDIIKTLKLKIIDSGDYLNTDCFEPVEEVKPLLDFIVDELHISITNYRTVEEK